MGRHNHLSQENWLESQAETESRNINSVRESPMVYETRLAGSSEVVFDDIGEWVVRGLTVRTLDDRATSPTSPTADSNDSPNQPHIDTSEHPDHGYLAAYERSTSPSDSDSTQGSPHKVTKIGNVPIAEYEGSPRRYGPRPSPNATSPKTVTQPHHGPPPRPPRPGFPKRVSGSDDSKRDSRERENRGKENREKEIREREIKEREIKEREIRDREMRDREMRDLEI